MLDHHTQQRNISNKTRQQHDSSYVPQNVAFPFCFFSQRRRRWRRRRRRFTAHGVGARPPRLDRREAAGPGARGLRPASQNRRSGQRLLGGACCFLYDSFFIHFHVIGSRFPIHLVSTPFIHSFIHLSFYGSGLLIGLLSRSSQRSIPKHGPGQFYRVLLGFTEFL